jgi:ABC-type branched-subunit amino acid transport system substrate-binding protein
MVGHGGLRRLVMGGLSAALVMVGLAACSSSTKSSSSSSTVSSTAATSASPTTAAAAGAGSSNGYADPSDGVTASTISVGVVEDLTGPTASTETPYVDGARAYFDANPKVDGRTINLVVKDTQYDTPTCISDYKQLVSDTPTVAILGISDSDCQEALETQIAQNKVPVIGSQVTLKDDLNPFDPYLFSLVCDFSEQADVAFAEGVKLSGKSAPRVAVIGQTGASAIEWGDLMKERATKAGGTYLGLQQIDGTAIDATAQAQTLASEKPDFIAFLGGSPVAVTLMKAMGALGLTSTPIVGNSSPTVPATWEGSPPAVAQNFYGTDCYAPPAEATDTAIQTAASANGYSQYLNNLNFSVGWVAALVTATGLSDTPNPNRQNLTNALTTINNLDTGGLTPNVTFGPNLREGVQGARPYTFNTTTKTVQPVGNYNDYANDIQHEYLPNQ